MVCGAGACQSEGERHKNTTALNELAACLDDEAHDGLKLCEMKRGRVSK